MRTKIRRVRGVIVKKTREQLLWSLTRTQFKCICFFLKNLYFIFKWMYETWWAWCGVVALHSFPSFVVFLCSILLPPSNAFWWQNKQTMPYYTKCTIIIILVVIVNTYNTLKCPLPRSIDIHNAKKQAMHHHCYQRHHQLATESANQPAREIFIHAAIWVKFTFTYTPTSIHMYMRRNDSIILMRTRTTLPQWRTSVLCVIQQR